MSRQSRTPYNRRKPVAPPPARWRGHMVLTLVLVFAGALLARAFYLQVLDRAFLDQQGRMRHVRTLSVPSLRGGIVDRNGEPLAISAPTQTIWAVPGEVLKSPDRIEALAKALDTSTAQLRRRLHKYDGRKFMYLARQLSPSHARKVMALNVPGVFEQREFKRYYPAGEAVAPLVGLVNIDGHGQLGMELAKNDFLDGQPGNRRVIKDRLGRVVENLDDFQPPKAGHQLQLTINLRLQDMAYNELKKAVTANKAAHGMVVILDPDSGQLLALASYPSFNPNNRATITQKGMRERPVTDIFEPGSSIKPILLSQALDSPQFSTNSRIDTQGGRIRVDNLVITDYGDYGHESFATILQKSSNVGAATVGMEMGAEGVWKAYRQFGLGMTTGTDFPGEAHGILKPYNLWSKVDTATASYGYGVAVTALQLVRAYGAIANGGWLQPLSLIIGPGSHMQPPARQVISAKTAREIRHMLDGVVSPEGTAQRADIPGYSEGGKTGTARVIVNGGYSHQAHQAVFVGMAPIDKPDLVTLVLIDQPTAGHYYAGRVAAPVFANVMRKALRIRHVPPTFPKQVAGNLDRQEVS